jgi:hypothetical protein
VLAPRAGFEPATNRLTAGCSTTELPGNTGALACESRGYNKAARALKALKMPDVLIPRNADVFFASPGLTGKFSSLAGVEMPQQCRGRRRWTTKRGAGRGRSPRAHRAVGGLERCYSGPDETERLMPRLRWGFCAAKLRFSRKLDLGRVRSRGERSDRNAAESSMSVSSRIIGRSTPLTR